MFKGKGVAGVDKRGLQHRRTGQFHGLQQSDKVVKLGTLDEVPHRFPNRVKHRLNRGFAGELRVYLRNIEGVVAKRAGTTNTQRIRCAGVPHVGIDGLKCDGP